MYRAATLFLLASLAFADPAPSPAQLFQEARAAWAAEGGRTWGLSLAGPLLLVDPESREVWASQADAGHLLEPRDGLFHGRLPDSIGIANTALDWSGTRWSMVQMPLPESAQARRVLLVHESWHRVQPQVGLDVPDSPCGHLDKLEGRIWLQLEWRALANALESAGKAREAWIADALACRWRRQELYPGGVEAERNQELAEGLAEYTGIRAADAQLALVGRLRKPHAPYARSFAYQSGPAYGLLLDAAAPGWTRRLRRAGDLSVLLQETLRLPVPTRTQAEAAATRLEGSVLRTAESAREQERVSRLEKAVSPLTRGPYLELPGSFRIQFNPNNTESLDDGSAYHPTATYLGAWGRLEVTGGSLRGADWDWVRVPVPADPAARPLKGPGWTLTLSPGWTLKPSAPRGCYQLTDK